MALCFEYCAMLIINMGETQFSFYFILGIITSCHFAQHLAIHLTIYGSLEEHMPSGVCSIKLQYDQVHKS